MSIDLTLAAGVIITGLSVVFIALIGLSVIVWLVGRLFVAVSGSKKPDAPKAASQPKPDAPAPQAPVRAQAASNAPAVEDGIGDEIVAVIAAAVAAMSGENGSGFALRSVRRAREARPAWAQAGLMQNTQPF